MINATPTTSECIDLFFNNKKITKKAIHSEVLKIADMEELAHLAIEAGALGIFDENLLTEEIIATKRFYEIFGVTAFTNPYEYLSMVHPPDISIRKEAYKIALQTGKLAYEARILWKDHSLHWIKINGKVFFDNGKPVRILGTLRDITNHILYVDELENKVKQRTKELKLFSEKLVEKNNELMQFAYIASHDLQEPLRKIQTFALHIIKKEQQNLSDYGKECFLRLKQAAERMRTLIEDLLNYSKINVHEKVYEKTNLNKILNEVKDELQEMIKEKQATIILGKLHEINIIPFQFRQLMNNLVGNALKFSHPQKPLYIKIKSKISKGSTLKNEKLISKKKYCHISVVDNGIGFDPQFSERIFEIFHRLHGQDKYKGTGIGLAICKKIVENHNGIIVATGKLNKGAIFDIYLPIALPPSGQTYIDFN